MDAVGLTGKDQFALRMIFSRTAVSSYECGCPKCRKEYYYSWNMNKTDCPYKAGALQLLEEYLK